MDIDPVVAKEMLGTSVGNRSLRVWWVNLLSAAMKRGEWRVTSNGVGFNWRGQLVDAHHRLHAVVQSGATVPTVVVLGLRDDAYEVIDTGILRTVSDRLNVDPRVGEVLRLGCSIVFGTNKPTLDQMRPVIEAGLKDAAELLVERCGSKQRFVTSAAMRLAACITVMNGGDADYVLQQYRALATMDFESMSDASQALVRQLQSGKAQASHKREALARGLRVFDVNRRNLTKIQISKEDPEAANGLVKSVLLESVRSAALEQGRRNGVAGGRLAGIHATDNGHGRLNGTESRVSVPF
jgi:hypothetical protein